MKKLDHFRGEVLPISPLLGTWLSTGSPIVAELASLCGFGWLLLDLEHGSFSEGKPPFKSTGAAALSGSGHCTCAHPRARTDWPRSGLGCGRNHGTACFQCT